MYLVESAKADEVDGWLRAQIDKARQDAGKRRDRRRAAAGKALQAMRFRGESVASIAKQAGISPSKVREYLKLAAADATAPTAAPRVVPQPPPAQAVPSATNGGHPGHSEPNRDVFAH